MSILKYRKVFSVLAIACLCFSGLLLAQIPKTTDDEKLTRLIEQLGDRQYKKRELAQAELKALGEKILPKLRALDSDTDLERIMRARETIKQILEDCATQKHGQVQMLPIRAGEFKMGSPKTERSRRPDEAEHTVKITGDFLMGKYEVSQAQFTKLMKFNPSWFHAKGFGSIRVDKIDTDNFPVECVTWFDAIEFCNRLSEEAGYLAYYKLEDVKKEGSSIKSATVTKLGGNGYRLPTEAEWEYACRAGTTSSYHFGENPRKEWIHCKPILYEGGYGSSLQWPEVPRTEPCGKTESNEWKFSEMHGNVGEWCWDWYDREYYETSPKENPEGPEKGTHRVVRGGSWLVTQYSCRSAARLFHAVDDPKSHIGFRVARTPGPPRSSK